MGSTQLRDWSADDWEDYVHRLLSLRYGPADYQRVPSTHGGDCGIEGFSRDGVVYQSYANEEYTTAQQLYERQRNKLTTDIGKFINNSARLLPMFSSMQIRRWLLVVPHFSSQKLVEACAVGTARVRNASLAYVTVDFEAGVVSDDDFVAERAQLAGIGLAMVQLEHMPDETDPVKPELIQRMDEKLRDIPEYADDLRREKNIDLFVRGYVSGQWFLDRMRDSYPDVYRALLATKRHRERQLETESSVAPLRTARELQESIAAYRSEILDRVPSAEPYVEDLTREAVADWLFRCPLSFR